MSIQELKSAVKSLSAHDWDEFLDWIFDDEVKRRQALPAVEEAQVEMVKDLAAQGEITRPDVATEEAAINGDGIIPAWHSPQGKKHKAYFLGEAVMDEGRIYINRRDGLNYAKPSAPDSGWEVYNPPKEDEQAEAPTGGRVEESPAPSTPAWREPANKAELYPAGAIVTHKGKQWRSTTDGNRAEPGTDNSWEETGEEA
ncbi:hypothetical protein [Corynebacterium macginleyi]|uniref:hypothetical protein n=1 Tax=Corynebacterium macginleyi TaxID=38290 RepID=UPI000EF9E3A0|nr:hypothetical protein [Corynebacterium macginleyi]QRP20907.1 hypothetical protein I6J25_09485 [Corynebacterium macginleyi]RMB65074.1 hypothetical protein D9V82_09355 [Corynebacterium macginleyi]